MALHEVRHNERTPEAPILPPKMGGRIDVDENVLAGRIALLLVRVQDPIWGLLTLRFPQRSQSREQLS